MDRWSLRLLQPLCTIYGVSARFAGVASFADCRRSTPAETTPPHGRRFWVGGNVDHNINDRLGRLAIRGVFPRRTDNHNCRPASRFAYLVLWWLGLAMVRASSWISSRR